MERRRWRWRLLDGSVDRLYDRVAQIGRHVRGWNDQEKINEVRNKNIELRQTNFEMNNISEMDWIDSFDSEYLSYDLKVKLHSLRIISEGVCKLLFLHPLLKTENKFLTERAKSKILCLRLKWQWDHNEYLRVDMCAFQQILMLPPRRLLRRVFCRLAIVWSWLTYLLPIGSICTY